MRVAIYETVHLDWIIPYVELLADEDMLITFITSHTFKNDLKGILAEENSRFSWYFLDPGCGYIEFSKNVYSVLSNTQYDLVVLNSIDSRLLAIFMILMFSKPGRILVNLHDINNFFTIRFSLTLRANVRTLGKKLLMLLTDGYIVNAESMKDHMLKNQLTKKPVHWLPPVYYKPPLYDKKTPFAHTIVIPGSIDQRRRDYNLVLDVIQEMLDQRVIIKWILAGKPVEDYGFRVIERAKILNAQGADISFYEDIIPESQFQQIIEGSTFILSPLVSTTTIHDNILEVYGQSKGSGNIYDAIRHAKPFFVPSNIAVPKEIETSCITFWSKENLVEQLLKILTTNSLLLDYERAARKNSENFTKERIKNMFRDALLEASS